MLPPGLIDEYLLMIHPLVLGSGRCLFEHDDQRVELDLVDSQIASSGVLIAIFQPA